MAADVHADSQTWTLYPGFELRAAATKPTALRSGSTIPPACC